MSLDLIDIRSKVSLEVDLALEARCRATSMDKSELVRDVLTKWARTEIHVAKLLQASLQREGIAGKAGE